MFAVKDSDLQLFCREAKKYGILYCVLKDRDATDGLTDIMARAEDASKINRIIERFGLATVDMAQVKQEIEQSRTERRENSPEAPAVEPVAEVGSPQEPMTEQEVDGLLDAMLIPPPSRRMWSIFWTLCRPAPCSVIPSSSSCSIRRRGTGRNWPIC